MALLAAGALLPYRDRSHRALRGAVRAAIINPCIDLAVALHRLPACAQALIAM